MFSRITHTVLLLAVAVLTIALMRASSRNAAMSPALSVQANDSAGGSSGAVASAVDRSASDELFMLGAALGPFDSNEFAGDLPAADVSGDDHHGSLVFAGESATQSPPAADGGRSHRNWNGGAGNTGGAGNGTDERGRGGIPKITEEIAARCLEVASEVDPELARRLLDARQQNPEEFEQQMRAGGFGRRLLALAQLKTHDPLLYRQKISELSQAVQIERKTKELRAAKANPDVSLGDVQSLETQLRTLLQIQLAMSIKARGDLLCKFNDRVAELQKELERDASNFQSIVDARLKVLTSDPVANSGSAPVQAPPADAKPAGVIPAAGDAPTKS